MKWNWQWRNWTISFRKTLFENRFGRDVIPFDITLNGNYALHKLFYVLTSQLSVYRESYTFGHSSINLSTATYLFFSVAFSVSNFAKRGAKIIINNERLAKNYHFLFENVFFVVCTSTALSECIHFTSSEKIPEAKRSTHYMGDALML